jgi:cytochrome bd-type quinol oxidase subunit 2
MVTGQVKTQSEYVQKTAKLIPAEALALYLTVSGQIKAASIAEDVIERYITLGAAVFIGVVVVPFVLYKLKHVRSGTHYVISVFAFALWVFNAQYDRLPSISPYDSLNVAMGSIVLLIFTFMAPLLLPDSK